MKTRPIRRKILSTELNPDRPVFLGIDGGGTHSFAAAIDSAGKVLATARAGSLNFFSAGLPVARHNLKKLARSI